MSLPVIVIGAGGHARVLIDALQLNSVEILGIVDRDPALIGETILGHKVIGSDEEIFKQSKGRMSLVNGIGSVAVSKKRCELFEKFISKGYRFAKVIHPSAILAADILLGEGSQVMAGAVVQSGTRIGCNTIVNTRVSVDHDCVIGNHVHLAPGVTLSGGVTIDDGGHVGTGATIIQGIHIEKESLVGAASLVLKNVSARSKVLGVPAKQRAMK